MAIGIAGLFRAARCNLIAQEGNALATAGRIDTLVVTKRGILTAGERRATGFCPLPGVAASAFRNAALLAALGNTTSEDRSILRLAMEHGAEDAVGYQDVSFVPWSAATGLSGLDLANGRGIRKGPAQAIRAFVEAGAGQYPAQADRIANRVASRGETPVVLANGAHVLGVIALADEFRTGVRERLQRLARSGVRTVLITDDNPIGAGAFAARAGVHDHRAETSPEARMDLIRHEQARGRVVAMMGHSASDALALAQADVALCLHSGNDAAREAAQVIAPDCDPDRLFRIIETGKALRGRRRLLTCFALAADIGKYFVILPAILAGGIPALAGLDFLRAGGPSGVVLAGVIFNLLALTALLPMAWRGPRHPCSSSAVDSALRTGLYGIAGLLLPFAAMRVIDAVLTVFV